MVISCLGSILGPVIFILYTKELQQIAAKYGLDIQLYADDSQLYIGFKAADINQVTDITGRIENCLEEFKRWMTSNFMMLNEKKTELILLGTKHTMTNTPPLNIVVNGIGITSTSWEDEDKGKSLGIKLDENLSMQRQIASVRKTTFWQLSNLKMIGKYLTKDIKTMLVKTLILSKLDYCNALYANLPNYLIKKLENVLNAAIRFIHNLDQRCDELNHYYRESHILPVHYRIKYKVCLVTHKALHGDCPDYIKSLVQVYVPKKDALRTGGDPYMLATPPLVRSSLVERRFSYHAPSIWNILPKDIRSCKSTDAFKNKLKTHYFRDYSSN